jgi:hypothetical protein
MGYVLTAERLHWHHLCHTIIPHTILQHLLLADVRSILSSVRKTLSCNILLCVGEQNIKDSHYSLHFWCSSSIVTPSLRTIYSNAVTSGIQMAYIILHRFRKWWRLWKHNTALRSFLVFIKNTSSNIMHEMWYSENWSVNDINIVRAEWEEGEIINQRNFTKKNPLSSQFLVYFFIWGLFNDLSADQGIDWYDDLEVMNWKGCSRKWTWSDLTYYLVTCMDGLKNTTNNTSHFGGSLGWYLNLTYCNSQWSSYHNDNVYLMSNTKFEENGLITTHMLGCIVEWAKWALWVQMLDTLTQIFHQFLRLFCKCQNSTFKETMANSLSTLPKSS